MDANKLTELYASMTFTDDVMKERIPKSTYKAFHETLQRQEPLSKEVATVIANAMKVWAVELGATHYIHWFSPMSGNTAGKCDAFLEPTDDMHAILEFSGKSLRKGEPDASSFPSGGLRATFEARGYTAWDCTSPAFVYQNTLYIPTLFCSYTGEALDKKTPLLRSCDALSKEGVRLCHLLGLKDVTKVSPSVGAEQEYFLVDRQYYEKRLDLRLTGRTLFGAKPPKGQEMDDHYFGQLKRRVAAFMDELDRELWKQGIPSKTKHNEAAPAQHEVACVYREANLTADNNHLMMDMMLRIAKNHDLICLLHEKPFAKVNGSGKHNNWSVVTDTGVNLFNPGANPKDNLPFLAVFACTIKAIDEYADMLMMSVSSAGNDQRLGGHEAPPSIMSVFIGEELEDIVEELIDGVAKDTRHDERFETGVSVIPTFSKDKTDRNRTSPFAFTGNKFEFRALGASQSISGANTILNTILASAMKEMSDLIEKEGYDVHQVIRKFLKEHQRIIFNGDGYSLKWQEEAARRGLVNAKNTVESVKVLKNKQQTAIFSEMGVYSEVELESRYDILLHNYNVTIQVEANTALRMVKTQIYPAGVKYLGEISKDIANAKAAGIEANFLAKDIQAISNILSHIRTKVSILEEAVKLAQSSQKDIYGISCIYRDQVRQAIEDLRYSIDLLEENMDEAYWPIPTYIDLMFGI